jgi:CubicO group peptidase (beta-lactamase class C family)
VGRPKERIQKEARRLLLAGVSGHVFPGATACIAWWEGDTPTYAAACGGKLSFQEASAVRTDTFYDLASITKPVVAMAGLRLVATDRLTLDTRVDTLLADVRGGPGGAVTLEQLLTHRSGLAPWGGLYLDVPHDVGSSAARRWILSEASRRMEGAPDAADVYSDLGYMIAGEAIARAGGRTLEQVVAEEVTEPLGIADRLFFAGALATDERAELARRVAPTERCEWRGRIVRGEVHDENCAALGGVSGHAGMFGTAHGVAAFGIAVLGSLVGHANFLPKGLLELALAERPGGTHRLGWDQKGGNPSAAGRHMGPRSFGHLGFTGTSIWCDPDREIVVVLLTNRVHPSRANEKIKGFRPAFHDGVVAAFDR